MFYASSDVRWLFVTAKVLWEAHGILDYSDDDYPNYVHLRFLTFFTNMSLFDDILVTSRNNSRDFKFAHSQFSCLLTLFPLPAVPAA